MLEGDIIPHVVIVGNITLKDIFDNFEPFTLQKERRILRVQKQYMDHDQTSIIIDALAIDEGKKCSFFVLVGQREDGLVIRIHPNSDVEKTDAVKMVLAEIAKQILQKFPDLRTGKTNLQDFL